MAELEHFRTLDGYAEYRPSGRVTLDQGVQLVTSAIAFARKQQVRRLLVVTAGLTGVVPPTLSARYLMMQTWATTAKGLVKVAVVTRPEMVDPQKFGVTVAANFGLTFNIFIAEEEALAWLLAVE